MKRLLSHLLQRSAERFPEREAVRCHAESLSFSDLALLSDGAAAILHSLGLRRGDRAGIFMNKSCDSAVALYGIMKAGGTYIPLDPFAPPSRIAAIVRDCGIRHLLTTDVRLEQSSLLSEDLGPLTHLIGSRDRDGFQCCEWSEVSEAKGERPPGISQTEEDVAYILYTSGSTGTPKGIVHTHGSGLSFAEWAAKTFSLNFEDRVSNHAPLHFDLSTFDFFASAKAGAATVIVPEAITRLPANLAKLIETERLTIWYSTPFALIQLLERGALGRVDWSSLRWILFAGEVFPTKHLRKLMQSVPHARFSNLFGPTETNVCTYYHVPEPPSGNEPIPIGRPCENVEALIVDESDRVVEAGRVGELLIRGGVVMKGYWGREDLNVRSFFRGFAPNDASQAPYYRTGDLVQEGSDGNLRYLGRKDRQIKTRGYRVELDEVETALLSFPGIQEAAAFPVPDGQGSHLIEAAVAAAASKPATESQLLNHVSGKLPHYAVPAKIRVLESFPRTSTGKIDRRRLQDLAETFSES